MKNLQKYLEWLITPQNEKEAIFFRENNLVDAYIEIKSRIPFMSEQELINEINTQIKPYELQIKQKNDGKI